MKEEIYLYIFLTIILACLIIILALILIVLLVPLNYKLELVINQPLPQINFSLANCCYGLQFIKKDKSVILQLKLWGFNWPLKQLSSVNTPDHPVGSAPTRKSSFSPRLMQRLALYSNLMHPIGELIKGIWCIIRPQNMIIKARVGFAEPHYTGWLMALAGILQAMNHAYRIELEGVWDEPCIEGALILTGRLILAQILWQLLKFFLKPEIRATYKLIRAQKSPAQYQTAA